MYNEQTYLKLHEEHTNKLLEFLRGSYRTTPFH